MENNTCYGTIVVLSADGQAERDSFLMTQPRVVIGRHSDCDIQINKPEVGNRHAVIIIDENRKACLKPRRQVLLRDKSVPNTVTLSHRDVFTICGRSFRWEYPKSTSTPSTPKKPLSVKNTLESNTPSKSSPANTPTPKKKRRTQKRRGMSQPPTPATFEISVMDLLQEATIESIEVPSLQLDAGAEVIETPSIPQLEPVAQEELSKEEHIQEDLPAQLEETTLEVPQPVEVVPRQEYERMRTEMETNFRRRELELEAHISQLQKQVEELSKPPVLPSTTSQASLTEQVTTQEVACNTEHDFEAHSKRQATEITELREQLLSWMTVSMKLEHLFRGESVHPVDQEELLQEISQSQIKFEMWPALILRKLMPTQN